MLFLLKCVLLLECNQDLMESIYINFQNCSVEDLGGKAHRKIKRATNKLLEVIMSAMPVTWRGLSRRVRS